MKRINLTPIFLFSMLAIGCRPSVDTAQDFAGAEAVDAKVAIIVDSTVSFASRLPDVQKLVTSFVAQNAVIGDAEVYLYRLDRQPKLVSRIKASEFMTSSQSALVRSIGEPTSNTGTDLLTAIEMATEKLSAKTETVAERKFLLVFTDGHIDPAKDGDRSRQFRGLGEFDWKTVEGVTTRFFFLDYEPYRDLTRATSGQGLDLVCFEDGESISVKDLRMMVEGGQ